MYDCFRARVYVHLAITLTATLALMLCYLDVIDSMSLSFNPTYRIERLLLFWASVASSRKCWDRLGTRKKFRVNRPDFQQRIYGKCRHDGKVNFRRKSAQVERREGEGKVKVFLSGLFPSWRKRPFMKENPFVTFEWFCLCKCSVEKNCECSNIYEWFLELYCEGFFIRIQNHPVDLFERW